MEEPLENSRSRASWNERFAHWERPPSDSEEQQIQRAAKMVREALQANRRLTDEAVTIQPQGSYQNNTNVRLEADMDLRAVHPDLKIEYASDVIIDYAKSNLGIFDTGRTYAQISHDMREQITNELISTFGQNCVDATGNKAIRLTKQPGTRADVDIVPCFRLYWIEWNAATGRYDTHEGISILSKDGRWTYNFPNQHYANGVTKRERTSYRFKRNVRILKRLRDELADIGHLSADDVPSFLIESLTHCVEDIHFLQEQDDRYDRARRLLYRMRQLLSNTDWAQTAREINGLKYLFHPSQPWTLASANRYISAALQRLEG